MKNDLCVNFESKVTYLLVTLCLMCSMPGSVNAQDPEESDQELYSRPEFNIYTNLRAAVNNADSVYILVLKGKKFKEFPPEIFKFPNLIVLDLSRNKIRQIPEEIRNLSGLQELDLSSNKIKELPVAVTELSELRKLSLNRNVITALPDDIGNLSELQILELWDNELEGLPEGIRDLRKLHMLEMRGILFSAEEQDYMRDMLPDTKILLSPPCNCK